MAKGADTEEFVVLSQVRAGLKREFAFAMKVQNEISGSLGRTRSTRKVGVGGGGGGRLNGGRREKKLKISEAKNAGGNVVDEEEDEAKSDVVDGSGGDGLVVDDELGGGECELGSGGDGVVVSGEEEGARMDGENPLLLGYKAVDDYLMCGNEPMEEEKEKVESRMWSIDDPLVDEATFEKEQAAGTDPAKARVGEKPLKTFTRTVFRRKTESEILKKLEPSGKELASVHNALENQGENMDPTEPSLEDLNKARDAMPKKMLRRLTRSGKNAAVEDDEEDRDINIRGRMVTLPAKVFKKFSHARKKFPTKLKDLLETGILEGQHVKYMKGPKARAAKDYMGLEGVIEGTGIVCHCDSCKGKEVVSPTVFELHAGSSNKRPPEYTYLENGSTLRDVIKACQNSPLISLEEAVQSVIGCSLIGKCTICFYCKGSMPEAANRKAILLCNSCVELKESQPNMVGIANNCDEPPKPVFTPKFADSLLKGNSSQSKSQGRITKKDGRLHKLVFEEDVLPDGTEVAYYSRGKKYLVGYKMGSGIICSCCNSEVSPSQFESHAGWATRRKPYLHIYTSNGVSLHELSLSVSRDRKFSTHENDDLCFVCRDGGDLLCCDGCPRAFHGWCINLPSAPTGSWFCKLCQNLSLKEKHVEHKTNALAAGRVLGIDSIEQITNRCIRIMNTGEIEFGGCALCGGHDFSKSGFGPQTVLFCDQCEKEFHVGCLKDHGLQDLKELPQGMWFCCEECDRINATLEKLVVSGEKELPDTLLNVLTKKNHFEAQPEIKWRVLNGKMASSEDTELLLSTAVTIFQDQFAPIIDAATRRDLIPEMIYGNSIMGQDFSQMYCAILTVDQCLVSAGIFRIYGSEVAELPLVATHSIYQGQGYFQALFSCFERFLCSLNVRNLVLPAANEAESIWINKFGFSRLTQDVLNHFRKQYPMMFFQGTSMLWKSIPSAESLRDKMV
ncbi:hypothetical protein TIFTF001_028918 [Ficus carica]|uniref:PHD-type domain-containing protein n=1 Tax=Ficus carica TaxID=3494 RepID=A0AA88DRG3_FICCA|nr:hypothetical protein TIFTF001_028918 [Ficus carica]